jgi:hypothetical protein
MHVEEVSIATTLANVSATLSRIIITLNKGLIIHVTCERSLGLSSCSP